VRAITDELDVSHVELAFGELVLYASRTDAHGNRYSVLSSAPLSASFRLGLE
jgi:2'-5' RNA ligase